MSKQPTEEYEQQIGELTADLQRTRADFENYRKRVDLEKTLAREAGRNTAIVKLLPVIDTIERAVGHMPEELADNKWAQGISGVAKNLEKIMADFGLEKINAQSGAPFNPELHEAIQFDEDATGEEEVVAEELQAGYLQDGKPIRHAMVRVTRR